MIKVQNNTATREPLPSFLQGLKLESLADLSWTDPQLGVQDAKWLPEIDETPSLGPDQVYDGTEALTLDAERQVVVVVRGIRNMTTEELHERWLAENPVPDQVPRYCGLLALKRHRVDAGQLQPLDESEDWQAGFSLYAQVLAYRAAMPAGAARDRLDVALNDVLNWMRTSPTVADLCAVLQLSDAQRDALFVWAKAHEATL